MGHFHLKLRLPGEIFEIPKNLSLKKNRVFFLSSRYKRQRKHVKFKIPGNLFITKEGSISLNICAFI